MGAMVILGRAETTCTDRTVARVEKIMWERGCLPKHTFVPETYRGDNSEAGYLSVSNLEI